MAEHVHQCEWEGHRGKEDFGCQCECGSLFFAGTGWQTVQTWVNHELVRKGVVTEEPETDWRQAGMIYPDLLNLGNSYMWTGTEAIPLDGREIPWDKFPALQEALRQSLNGPFPFGQSDTGFNIPNFQGRVVEPEEKNEPCAVHITDPSGEEVYAPRIEERPLLRELGERLHEDEPHFEYRVKVPGGRGGRDDGQVYSGTDRVSAESWLQGLSPKGAWLEKRPVGPWRRVDL